MYGNKKYHWKKLILSWVNLKSQYCYNLNSLDLQTIYKQKTVNLIWITFVHTTKLLLEYSFDAFLCKSNK